MAQEIEIKFRISNISELSSRLAENGFQLKTQRTHEMNTLYDLPGRPLLGRGELLRLRKYGPEWTITFKAKGVAGRYKSRREIETQVDDGEAMAQILRAAGFEPGFSYEKFRTEWADSQGHVVIDETPLGNFGEIEGPPEWIDSIARKMGISPDQYITESYAQLFLQWKSATASKAENMLFAETAKKE